MKIGFPRPRMEEEKRIALLPSDIERFVEFPDRLYFERGYGEDFGLRDKTFKDTGAHIVGTERVYNLEGLCQPKFCERDAVHMSRKDQVVFGWLHLINGRELTRFLMANNDTCISWELMKRRKRSIFYMNGVLTGRIGVLHGMPHAGFAPEDCKVAVVGRGRVGSAAIDQLKKIGVRKLTVYHTGNTHLLKRNLPTYDVLVNCACSAEEILTPADLIRLKPGAFLIDIGSDCIGGNLYHGQSIYSPIISINDGKNQVYCVNHVPTLVFRSATKYNSRNVAPYIDLLSKDQRNSVINKAVVIDHGKPVAERL